MPPAGVAAGGAHARLLTKNTIAVRASPLLIVPAALRPRQGYGCVCPTFSSAQRASQPRQIAVSLVPSLGDRRYLRARIDPSGKGSVTRAAWVTGPLRPSSTSSPGE